jgi:GntR family transcriptional regulator
LNILTLHLTEKCHFIRTFLENDQMNITIDHHNKILLHLQVEALIRKLLNGEPEYKNGAFLPKEQEPANRLGVSRNTIRQATNKLEYEGVLIRKKGLDSGR